MASVSRAVLDVELNFLRTGGAEQIVKAPSTVSIAIAVESAQYSVNTIGCTYVHCLIYMFKY